MPQFWGALHRHASRTSSGKHHLCCHPWWPQRLLGAKQISSHWDELMAACKTSNNELKKAVECKSASSKKAAKAKPKSKAKAAGKAKAKPMYKLFDLAGGPDITEYTSYPLSEVHWLGDFASDGVSWAWEHMKQIHQQNHLPQPQVLGACCSESSSRACSP